MNFNNATHITCANGLAVPVNPYDSKYKHWAEYRYWDTWLSQQPKLHTNALDGTYPVDEFGEVVWQYLDPDDEWSNIDEFQISQKQLDKYDTRAFLPYIGPKKQESEPTALPTKSKQEFADKKEREGVFYKTVGNNIHQLRKRFKKSQDVLASEMGISRVALNCIESGKQRLLVHLLYHTANILNTTIDGLLNGIDFSDSIIPVIENNPHDHLIKRAEDKLAEIAPNEVANYLLWKDEQKGVEQGEEKPVQIKIGGDTYFTHLAGGLISILTKDGCVELHPEEIAELKKFI